jgi:glycine/D-amino acid oxidase-like deaminating enzyme
MASERVDAVIVGAGIAGLTTARRLVKRGARCIVREVAPCSLGP